MNIKQININQSKSIKDLIIDNKNDFINRLMDELKNKDNEIERLKRQLNEGQEKKTLSLENVENKQASMSYIDGSYKRDLKKTG